MIIINNELMIINQNKTRKRNLLIHEVLNKVQNSAT